MPCGDPQGLNGQLLWISKAYTNDIMRACTRAECTWADVCLRVFAGGCRATRNCRRWGPSPSGQERRHRPPPQSIRPQVRLHAGVGQSGGCPCSTAKADIDDWGLMYFISHTQVTSWRCASVGGRIVCEGISLRFVGALIILRDFTVGALRVSRAMLLYPPMRPPVSLRLLSPTSSLDLSTCSVWPQHAQPIRD